MLFLDSAFKNTVGGKSCLNDYLETLSVNDGKTGESKKKVKIPRKIGNTAVAILTYVADNNLPFLLSKEAMKKAGTKILQEIN